jgi:hypothetical protein
MKFRIEIQEGNYGVRKNISFQTLEELQERIKNKKTTETILSIREYHLVYAHPIHLPPCDYIHEWTKHEVYKENIKIPKDQIQTVKQSSYQHNLRKEKEYNNYCLKYDYLALHPEWGYFYKASAVYDLRNHDLKGTMKALYRLSRSNQIFNLCFYQYRYLSLDEIMDKSK